MILCEVMRSFSTTVPKMSPALMLWPSTKFIGWYLGWCVWVGLSWGG